MVAVFIAYAQARKGGASGPKTWYTKEFRSPLAKWDWVRGYVTSSTSSPKSDLVAVGVQLTRGLLDSAQELPIDLALVIPGLNFNYTAHEWDFELPDIAGNPFSYMRMGFNHNGHPASHNPPFGTWDNPHWDFHFHFGKMDDWAMVFDPTKMGACFGANPEIYLDSCKPVADQCFPKGAYANVNEFVWRHGQHLADFTAPEFNPPTVFDQSIIWGQQGGEVSFFEPMINHDFLKSATKAGTCFDITTTPDAFPTERLSPTKYCIREINGDSVVVELTNFIRVPAGDCTPSDTNPASPRSYCPWTDGAAPPDCKPPQP